MMLDTKSIIQTIKDAAEAATASSTDLLKDEFGHLSHYIELLEKVTKVNEEWNHNPALIEDLKAVKDRNIPICYNLGSGKITTSEIERIKTGFNVGRVFNIDIFQHENIDRVGDITCLDFEHSSVELTFNSSVLEHLHEPLKALQENYRILKEGGYAYFWIPFMWREHGDDLWRFTKEGLTTLLKKAGFSDFKIYPTQAGLSNVLRATLAQGMIPNFGKAVSDEKENMRRLLFLIVNEFANSFEPFLPDQFYGGLAVLCKK